jgi:hypothetical protein
MEPSLLERAMPSRDRKRRETVIGLLAIWLGMPGVFLCLAGILILGWQVYAWVKFGTWLPKPLLGLVLDVVEPETSWLVHPQSFAAVQPWVTGVLGLVPVSAFLIVTGLVVVTAAHKLGGRPPAKPHGGRLPKKPGWPDEWFGRN